MNGTPTLVEQATAVLARSHAYSNRAACWIARAALEQAVDRLLALHTCAATAASMRSKLTVLQVLLQHDDPAVPVRAQYAWHGLSRVCHHHAFELTPSASEVEALIDLVRALDPDVAPEPSIQPPPPGHSTE